ncbi:MAG: hypothetical protein ACREXR_11605 [Gammaproteobacteria bacterium]
MVINAHREVSHETLQHRKAQQIAAAHRLITEIDHIVDATIRNYRIPVDRVP